MITIESLGVDTTGWTLESDSADQRVWINQVPDAMQLDLLRAPPTLVAPVSGIDEIRSQYRRLLAEAGAGLVELETMLFESVAALRLIAKVPQQPHGMTYRGSILMPFEDLSFVLKVQAMEYGTTGLRDSIVAASLRPDFFEDEKDPFRNWCADPYDPRYRSPIQRNFSEDTKWDSKFPDHPLSRVRRYLARCQESLSLSDDLRRYPAWKGTSDSAAKTRSTPDGPVSRLRRWITGSRPQRKAK